MNPPFGRLARSCFSRAARYSPSVPIATRLKKRLRQAPGELWTLLPPNTHKEDGMYQTTIRHLFVTAAFLTFSMSAGSGEQRGVTDGEIRIGQTMPVVARSPPTSYSARRKSHTLT